jgi:hypothetical protein
VKFGKSQAYRLLELAKVPTVGNLLEEWRRICGRAQDEGGENGEMGATTEETPRRPKASGRPSPRWRQGKGRPSKN